MLLQADSASLFNEARATATALLAHCRDREWAGWDPYDALNSPLLRRFPVLDCRPSRLALTQLAKRCPSPLRGLLRVPRTVNPKATALFLTAFTTFPPAACPPRELPVSSTIDHLIALRSPHSRHHAWGYPFPWQTRTVLVPRGAPNLVTTCFAANALLDAYELRDDARCLTAATSAASYLTNELYCAEDTLIGFRYPTPLSPPTIHNANLLASALLCRVYRHTGDRTLLDVALRVARHSASRQQADGSWHYGESAAHRWVDNFHTGYNLCALRSIGIDAAVDEFTPHLHRGLAFYLAHFFRTDGAPTYFPNRPYPVDIHCVAQAMITLLTLRDLAHDAIERAHAIFRWAMTHMWDPRGFFYYRVHRLTTIRVDYIRWAQAWMCVALATLLKSLSYPPPSR